ncbi:hypothetical protein Emag_004883 [Eimeria magna]
MMMSMWRLTSLLPGNSLELTPRVQLAPPSSSFDRGARPLLTNSLPAGPLANSAEPLPSSFTFRSAAEDGRRLSQKPRALSGPLALLLSRSRLLLASPWISWDATGVEGSTPTSTTAVEDYPAVRLAAFLALNNSSSNSRKKKSLSLLCSLTCLCCTSISPPPGGAAAFRTSRCGIASSGMQADIQTLHKLLKLPFSFSSCCLSVLLRLHARGLTRVALFKHQHREEPSVVAVAQLLSTVLYSRRFFPYYTFNVLFGLDSEGAASLPCPSSITRSAAAAVAAAAILPAAAAAVPAVAVLAAAALPLPFLATLLLPLTDFARGCCCCSLRYMCCCLSSACASASMPLPAFDFAAAAATFNLLILASQFLILFALSLLLL